MRRRHSGLLVPDRDVVVKPQMLTLARGTFTEFGKKWIRERIDVEHIEWQCDLIRRRSQGPRPAMAGGSGTFSNWFQLATLGHGSGQDNASWANLSPAFLALCTAIPDSSKTGTTITEATYTGYARLSVPNTSWAAGVSGGAGGQSTIANNTTLTFAACTSGSSTITGWAYCTALTVGNVIAWGSCTSTVISTTQTPPTVASAALSLGLT